MNLNKSLNIPKLLVFFIFLLLTPFHSYSLETSFLDLKTQIVLDPGHGGNDLGAHSVSKLMEKDFSLYLAFALKNKLENHFHITLTRASDYSMTDTQRADIANSKNTALFISIHAGSLFTQQGMKNVFIGYLPKESASFIDPKTLAADLGEAFKKNRSKVFVIQAPFNKGMRLTMPFIHIELGNLNSPSESIEMKSPDFIDKTAETIAETIITFFSEQIAQAAEPL
ncbi:MAG: N-acetylmuramoyl-L-alanine amidase [Desulforegulaceae bacterium]|nr:N-acetylmuramoyl-L-alanine amidase [Desulforegulaceae bacterium]